ncbi:MAG TPA: hypothetical protein VFR37_03970 [Longimicrobium sp.]|nr:hypothetical protein [Longimicrobium sp.]
MAYLSDRPCIVSLENLTEAAAVGVNLALVEQESVFAVSAELPGTTMGYFPTEP